MAGDGDIKKLGGMALALLSLAIIVGAVFLVSGSFQDSLCDQSFTGATYDGASCEYDNGTDFTTDPTSVQRVETVTAVIVTILSFLSIVVIVGIAKLILRVAKGMN
jgi:ABC-type sugar transport system permease subunit